MSDEVPEGAEHLKRAGMQDQRTGGPEGLWPPVNDPDSGTVVAGLQGKCQPGRTRASHQDARRFFHAASVRHHQGAESDAAPATMRGFSSSTSRRSPGSTT